MNGQVMIYFSPVFFLTRKKIMFNSEVATQVAIIYERYKRVCFVGEFVYDF